VEALTRKYEKEAPPEKWIIKKETIGDRVRTSRKKVGVGKTFEFTE
jgi:hypothetical protein